MDFSTSTDVLVEILLRLPPSARRRARLVCKLWRESVDERTTEMQSRAQPLLWNTRAAVAYTDDPSTGSCTVVWRSSRPCADPYADADLQLVGTCNGLLCLCDNGERSGGAVTLVNPATGESLLVPPLPCTEYVFGRRRCHRRWDKAYSFGYHPTSGRYKVVHVPCSFGGWSSGSDGVCDFGALQVLTLGQEATWREVPSAGDTRCNLEAGIVSVDGTTYWVTVGSAAARVMSFSLDDERVVAFAMPLAALLAGPGNYHLAEVHGRLGMVVHDRSASGRSTGVWVLTEKGLWTRRYSLHSHDLTRPHFVYGEDVLTHHGRLLYGHRPKSDMPLPYQVMKINDKDQGTPFARVSGETSFCRSRTYAYVQTMEPLGVYAAR
ncbi:hypothetical protein QYE76_006745 [Lolium multiflorum]|uniref:F-box domain-containing protein n=1 Tax=Lolium multiflorum TaxID=4521 RepID=A0AAD8W218_LOLMU|nr:hypothetical protein QYE76_006745 [Lolium multiflorum]